MPELTIPNLTFLVLDQLSFKKRLIFNNSHLEARIEMPNRVERWSGLVGASEAYSRIGRGVRCQLGAPY